VWGVQGGRVSVCVCGGGHVRAPQCMRGGDVGLCWRVWGMQGGRVSVWGGHVRAPQCMPYHSPNV
jgi:hypothetical protein